MAFGMTLRRLRKARGHTQERLAAVTGLDRTFISLLERGLRQPSLSTLLRVAEALEMTFSTLAQEIDAELGPENHSVRPNAG